MNRAVIKGASALARVISLVLLAAVATTLMMRSAPGYFADEREMDGQYAAVGRRAMEAQQAQDGSALHSITQQARGWMRGNLGRSRQYDVPVSELLRERAARTLKLVSESIVCGWTLAFALAIALSGRRTLRGEALIAAPPAILLAVPVGVMATLCLVADVGGPVLVLASLVAVRDFKMMYRLMRRTWRAPHFLYARAAGIPAWRVVRAHLLPTLSRELLALLMTSVVIALSLAVPVEVIFDVPGLGQLAWSAALNRDLPVLLAVTLLVAACVGAAGALADSAPDGRLLEQV